MTKRIIRDIVCPSDYSSRGGTYVCSSCGREIMPGEKYTATAQRNTDSANVNEVNLLDCKIFCSACQSSVSEV